MNTIYTWGYSGSTPQDLKAYIEELDARLIDIRYSPRSRVPQWAAGALLQVAGGSYTWLMALGNENYRGDGPIKLAAPEQALPTLQRELSQRSVILLCACRDVEQCHRKVAAEFLQRRLGAPVEHLPGRFADWQAAQVGRAS